MLAITYSRALTGIYAPLVSVETHLSNGLPKFSIVGLAETAVKESKDRVRSALLNANFEFPARRITVNLGPADLPKEGGHFDLAIAIGVLAASHQLPMIDLEHYEFAGELALSAALRPIYGSLPFAIATAKAKRHFILPSENAPEAALIQNLTVLPAKHLLDVCAHLTKQQAITPCEYRTCSSTRKPYPDLKEIRGQPHAKRALEIAAAGGHSLLMCGPPGTGKTMLANRLPGILPDLDEQQALEVAAILSLSKKTFDFSLWRKRPFRAPHHTASSIALVGGGRPPKPGEISLAHRGLLFLDELPEFPRHVLESLREPLESGVITISRAGQQAEFPAQFQFIAAMNPCPCGHLGNPHHECHCTAHQIQQYHRRLSSPLLDRIDLHIEVPALTRGDLMQADPSAETSRSVKPRIIHAYQTQLARAGQVNSQLTTEALTQTCALDSNLQSFLNDACIKFGLSARNYHRLLKVARTIADLAEKPTIEESDLLEALSYRRKINL